MNTHRRIFACLLILCVTAIILSACSAPEEPTTNYDPDKKYVAFAVIDVPASQSILANAKQQSTSEGFEIGPIEYYSTQTTDFDPIVKKLTISQQIKLIWVIGGVMDLPAVRNSAAKFGYDRGFRFLPVQAQTLPG